MKGTQPAQRGIARIPSAHLTPKAAATGTAALIRSAYLRGLRSLRLDSPSLSPADPDALGDRFDSALQ